MSVKIGCVRKFSLLDFPDKISAIIFTCGCNFRCGYCHNPELFSGEAEWDEEKFLEFLKTRCGKLDGVVITGGEPTIHEDLKEFIIKIKELNFLVKLDTNGTNPEFLNEIIEDNLIDYVAMDIKGPLDKYNLITKTNVNTENIKKSIKLLLNNQIPYEFRTTVLSSLLNIEDFESIGKLIKGCDRYYIQKFNPSKILDKLLLYDKGFTDSELKTIIEILKKYIKQVKVR